MLGAFGDRTNGGLKIQFRGMNVDFFSGTYGAKSGDGMGGVGNAELAAEGGRGDASLVVGDIRDFLAYNLRIGARCGANRGRDCRVRNR